MAETVERGGRLLQSACVLCCDVVRRFDGPGGAERWYLPGVRGDYFAADPCGHCRRRNGRVDSAGRKHG